MKLRAEKTCPLIFLVCMLVFSSLSVAAEAGGIETEDVPATPISLGWDVTLASKYIWQGFDYSNGGSVLQPEVYLAVDNFSATLWVNYDVDTSKTDELDLYFQYDWSFPSYAVSAGYAYFDYPQNAPHRDNWDASQELYLDLSYDNELNPSLSVHYDFDMGEGAYYALGLSHNYELAAANFDVAANLFYHDDYYGVSGIPSAELNASTSFVAGDYSIAPSISYFHTWENGDFRGADAVTDKWLLSINIARDY